MSARGPFTPGPRHPWSALVKPRAPLSGAAKHLGQIGRLYQLAKKRNFRTSSPQKNTEISPLFKCDSATRAFYGLKDGKITVNFSGRKQNRVVLKGAKPLR